MKLKTIELHGAALDWAVAKCEELQVYFEDGLVCLVGQPFDTYWKYWNPTTDWAQGGPIIERERIAIDWDHDCWNASTDSHPAYYSAETPLVAAMRCYVASKLGGQIEVPDDVIEVKLCS